MKIGFRDIRGIAIIDLEGNIDVNASDFVEAVGWTLSKRSRKIVCNFARVNLVDYVGISLIAVAYKNVLNHRGQMRICHLSPQIEKLFSLVGLNRVFDPYPDEAMALKSFRQDQRISRVLKRKLRRRFTRVPFRGVIEYRPKDSSDQALYSGKIINLSALGLFAVVDKPFPQDTILSSHIRFAARLDLEAETKVVWVADREIQPLESPGLGLEFHQIDSEKQKKIVDFVERHLTSI